MRIALFTYSTQPRGGVLHALALAEALHDLGHDVVLHALDDGARGFIRTPRSPYRCIPVESFRGSLEALVRKRVAEYVAAWDPTTPDFDVYHAHDGISANALADLVARGTIGGFVRTVHHLDDFVVPEMIALQDRSVVAAAGCLTVSRLWRERVAERYGIVATVVPSGVDAIRFSPVDAMERANVRARMGHTAGPLFVTIGGIEARKNSIATLEAFARVRALVPSARFIFAGGASVLDHGAYRNAFDARARELGLGDAVWLAGVLADDEIVSLLRAADAFVFPSLVEGFGLVLLEALACGTPVVTSDIEPFTEFLTRDDALFVTPSDPGDLAAAMLQALDPRLAARARQRGPALARRHAWSASALAHLEAYRAATGERSARA